MASKQNPGTYDCYANAEHDEEMFILLARDESAPFVVEFWRAIRAHNFGLAQAIAGQAVLTLQMTGKIPLPMDSPKSKEALCCSVRMAGQRRQTCGVMSPICNQRCTLPRFHKGDHQSWEVREIDGVRSTGCVSGWSDPGTSSRVCGVAAELNPKITCGLVHGHEGDHQTLDGERVVGFWTNKDRPGRDDVRKDEDFTS